MKVIVRAGLVVIIVFFLPALASLAVWSFGDHPESWRNADWSSSGLLPPTSAHDGAAIYVLAARTGGMKGALSVHSWIVLKRPGGTYDRYDRVGWGLPVRKNAYPADGRWYSNEPFVVKTILGEKAEHLIPQVEAAIAAYPARNREGYRLWPGPNSNSFVAYVLRSVPEIDVALPPLAIGRNYVPGKFISIDPDGRDIQLSIFGYAGVAVGARSGLEVSLLGLVAGLNFRQPGIKLPGFGHIGLQPGFHPERPQCFGSPTLPPHFPPPGLTRLGLAAEPAFAVLRRYAGGVVVPLAGQMVDAIAGIDADVALYRSVVPGIGEQAGAVVEGGGRQHDHAPEHEAHQASRQSAPPGS